MLALLLFKELGCIHLFSCLYAWFSLFKRSSWKLAELDLFLLLDQTEKEAFLFGFYFHSSLSLWKTSFCFWFKGFFLLIFYYNFVQRWIIGSLISFISFQISMFFFTFIHFCDFKIWLMLLSLLCVFGLHLWDLYCLDSGSESGKSLIFFSSKS